MPEIKVKCPAKINLTLEILNKREDGFHNIQSVMQTIDLFDILTISVEESENFEIKLTGTSDEIPYNEKNLVYKAAKLFIEALDPSPLAGEGGWKPDEGELNKSVRISIHIEKNIPVAAGLAGGSTDAAGTLWGLNEIFGKIAQTRGLSPLFKKAQNPAETGLLSKETLHELCAQLGSDLNFCLEGGCQLTTGRGEILEKLPFHEFSLSMIKPKDLGISAKEAYTKFSSLEKKPNLDMTTKLVQALNSNGCNVAEYLHNDLEYAVINDYEQLQKIKKSFPTSIMSGSGSTFFALNQDFKGFDDNFWIKPDLKSIPFGVCKEI